MLLSAVLLYTDFTTYEGAMNCMVRDSETPDWLRSYITQGPILRRYKLGVRMVIYIYYIIHNTVQFKIKFHHWSTTP